MSNGPVSDFQLELISDFLAMGKVDEALRSIKEMLVSRPDSVEVCFSFAEGIQTKHVMFSASVYEHLLQILPAHKKLHRKIKMKLSGLTGSAGSLYDDGLAALNRWDYENALSFFRQSSVLNPTHVETWYCIGLTLYHLRRYDESREALTQCLSLSPRHLDALNVMGCIYQVTGQCDKAIEYYKQVLEQRPEYILPLGNIPCALADAKRYNEAIEWYEYALTIHPEAINLLMELMQWKRRTCNWKDIKSFEDRLLARITKHNECATPFNITTYFTSAQMQRDNALRWTKHHYPAAASYDGAYPLPADIRGDGKIRIGYLSGDFNDHATAYLVCELFEIYDRNIFEIYAYSCGPSDQSVGRIRMQQSFKAFHDINPLNAQGAAQLIRNDGIDILVDMKGYTRDHRMDVVALRPAPIVMHYIGYPGTTGASFIDYFISDNVVTPEGSDHLFIEKLIRLSHSYQINDRKRQLPNTSEKRSSYGLPDKGFVFCALNGEFKNTPVMFDVWMRLLKAVPGSVLWIYASVPETKPNLLKEAELRGVDPARIVIAESAASTYHLPRYLCADLFLDTFPVGGHTTTSDALWLGVPVVTLAGENFGSRVATSLLHAVGLPELAVTTIEDYEKLALAIATDPKRLKQLKDYLDSKRMRLPLFDTPATVKAIEAAYLHAISLHRQGKPPRAFKITEDFKAV